MQLIRTAFSGDPDDAFAWWGIISGIVSDPLIRFRTSAHSLAFINHSCKSAEFDVAAISAATYPMIANDYVILASGASVARDTGPALLVRSDSAIGEPDGTFAVAGNETTAGLVFRLLFPSVGCREIHWSDIPQAISTGVVEGGVCVHETLMMHGRNGLRKIGCLGEMWRTLTGLPLPVGLVVARRSLGRNVLHRIAFLLRKSVRTARANRRTALNFAAGFSLGLPREQLEEYIDHFTNDDTEVLPEDARRAMDLLYSMAIERALLPAPAACDVVEIDSIPAVTNAAC